MTLVRDVMSTDLVAVSPELSLRDLIEGIITTTDVTRAVAHGKA